MSLPFHRQSPRPEPQLPAALMPPPPIAPALRERTVRVPMSLVAGAVQALAGVLPKVPGNPVVVFTQDYGMGHLSAVALLDALLREAGHAPAAVSAAAQLEWRRALRKSRPGAIVLSAAPRDLADDAPATPAATIVMELVPDPAGWPALVFTADLATQMDPVSSFMASVKHPFVARQRARAARSIRARIEQLLAVP